MKISYRNYPILEKLQKGSLGSMPISADDKPYFDEHHQFFVDTWKEHGDEFRNEINIISSPFEQASIKAKFKLFDLYKDIVTGDGLDFEIKGCFAVKGYVIMVDYEVKAGSDDSELFFYVFSKKGTPNIMYIDSNRLDLNYGWVSKGQGLLDDPDQIQMFAMSLFTDTLILALFKKYASVESKVLPPISRLKTDTGKYVNDTLLDVTYLDSKWFTTLVQSDGFSVRGHFRLQPKKKDGKWTKELIWIDKFEKEGYTSVARKLKQDD